MIIAIAAYLVKIGQEDKVKVVYKGAFIALWASLLMAVLLQYLIP